MKSAWLLLAVWSAVPAVLSSEVNTCVDTDANTGTALGFVFYDNWLKDSPESATSACQNHAAFYAANNDRFAAVTHALFEDSAACGACIQVRSASSNVTEVLTVVETVNSAGQGNIQVPASVAGRLAGGEANLVNGGVAVSWKFIECASKGNLEYRFAAGSTAENNAGLFLSNSVVGIRSVELRQGTSYVDLQREGSSMAFKLPSGAQAVPFRVRVTSATYEKVEFVVPDIVDDEVDRDTGVAFTGACFPPPTPAPTSPPKDTPHSSPSMESSATVSAAVSAVAIGVVAVFTAAMA